MSSTVEKEGAENIKEDSKNESDENEKSNKLDESRLQYENGKCFYKVDVYGLFIKFKYLQKENVYLSSAGKQYKWDNEANSWTVTNDSEPSKNSGNIKTVENDEEKEDENGGDDEEEEFDEGKSKKMKLVVRQDMSEGIYGTDGENHTYTDPNDGTVYVWDKEKNAWFPKIDDDFLAQYQMSYGFIKPDPSDSALPESKVQVDSDDKVRPKEDSVSKPEEKEDTWFEVGDEHNTKVYVSNLPTDITEQEFIDLMQKCGLVMKDVETGKMKIKLYTEPGSDMLKGDALCTYIKVSDLFI
ncbi:hypothetical protein O3M35_011921 [Rhynocoris fuscipes]|uniref:Uncharacterized protein n=1 Tax=Rhynocoris fuscipes TaxID=488301 RepID=A0AAW1D378_9HEMI